jgi:hypothetical protein
MVGSGIGLMEFWRGASIGVHRRLFGGLVVVVAWVGLCGVWCGDALAAVPSIRPSQSGETPFVQVEEFVPGVANVNAEFYANVADLTPSQSSTVTLQYVEAAGYDPTAADPYATGVSVALGVVSGSSTEVHAHLVLAPDVVYHYRIVASNVDGRAETPDLVVQTFPASVGVLPDGRVYEQVSPTAKNNVDALGNGFGMSLQASVSGSAFAFFSFEPFPIAAGTGGLNTDYLSTRASSPAAWSTQGAQAPLAPGLNGMNEVAGFTEDLTKTIVQVEGAPLGAPGTYNAYVHDNALGSYQLLAPNVGSVPILFVDATRDGSRILFETEQQLLPAAAAGKTNLYEWDEGRPEGQRLGLAGVLPDAECAALSLPSGCAPANGSGAGSGGKENQGASGQGYLQSTISEDGSKVFFTAHPSGRLYERESLAEPLPVTVTVSAGAATFLAATPSGRYVFYTEGGELYRFDTLTEMRQALSSGGESIPGGLGVSDDGTYAYFIANGVLVANDNANGEEALTGAPNLYEWHEDATTHATTTIFIARLVSVSGGGANPAEGDEADWISANWSVTQHGKEGKTSRLNPSGTALLFMSRASLTGEASACSEGPRQVPCNELFLYDAGAPLSSTNPVCVSCNQSGAVASAPVHLSQGEDEVALPGPEWAPHLTRNLSAGGNRVFFETAESLVPEDTNSVIDVYEWEREGVGSCPSGDGHCLYLISSGTSHARSFFGDASASGEDVFFFSRQPLVGQDKDLNFDVYDARVGGGIPAQNPVVTNCEGEGCNPPASSAPVFGAPGSSTLTGKGNPPPPPPPPPVVQPKKCARNQRLSHGKCVTIKCPKGRKLRHGKCVKARGKRKAGRAGNAAGFASRGSGR